jgi:hypothetical protein
MHLKDMESGNEMIGEGTKKEQGVAMRSQSPCITPKNQLKTDISCLCLFTTEGGVRSSELLFFLFGVGPLNMQ